MKVRPKRLASLLTAHGFTSVLRSHLSHGWIFVRPSHVDELFESIIVESQGKRGEAVYASVGIAVTKTVMYKELGDVQLLEELAEEPQRGWTIIQDDTKARLWEQKLASLGPMRAAQMAVNRGKQLLHETDQLRAIVKRYEDCISGSMKLSQSLDLLKRNCKDDLVLEAERLFNCELFEKEGVRALCYQVACHIISCKSEAIESIDFMGHDPEKDPDLLDRIELLTDRMFQRATINYSKAATEFPTRAEEEWWH